jgi:hypothetical protein
LGRRTRQGPRERRQHRPHFLIVGRFCETPGV